MGVTNHLLTGMILQVPLPKFNIDSKSDVFLIDFCLQIMASFCGVFMLVLEGAIPFLRRYRRKLIKG